LNIYQATSSFEKWTRECTPVIESDLRFKHDQMRTTLFLFFRGTFYRWTQLFPEICRDLSRAPKLLAVGDLHVGSFGTWRDFEGRLNWGVDDFDDSFPLPYTYDLVRLAASVRIAIDDENLCIGFKDGCDIILEAYRESLRNGGKPFVLAEAASHMEKLGIERIRPPKGFWDKLNHLPAVPRGQDLRSKAVLREVMPKPIHEFKIVHRRAGMGSLGQPRFVAIGECDGGFVAREAKKMTPSACRWLENRKSLDPYYQQLMSNAVRSPDPFQRTLKGWVIRRLSPDSNPIEIAELPRQRDDELLLHSMGEETANVHLASSRKIAAVLRHLQRQKANWLRSSAKAMAKAVEKDWKEYRKS
jgi:Uncharacterized protein conserved in bacteria (DUF2252)